jgi:hypothetical protein
VALFVVACWDGLRADVIYLKDGYILEGNVKEESTTVFDSTSGRLMTTPKLSGYFWVDDGPRKVAFSKKHFLDADKKNAARGTDPLLFDSRFRRVGGFRPPSGQYGAATPWNEKWDRDLTLETPRGELKVRQHVATLTPHFIRIDARQYYWDAHYLLSEMNPDAIRDLLLHHKEMRMTGDGGDAPKRFRLFRFLVKAGWYEKALAELDGILKEFPDQKEKVESARASVQRLLQAKLVEQLELAHKTGRHQTVQPQLRAFPRRDVDETLLTRVRTLESAYDAANRDLELARRYLEELPQALTESEPRIVFGPAAAALLAELNVDTIGRLETFLTFARQAERDREMKRTPAPSPEQLLSLAISGWLMGKAAAETKIETGLHLWRGRQFVLEYLRTHDLDLRKKMLAEYQRGGALAYDEMERLIHFLPPPEPFEQSSRSVGPWGVGALPLNSTPLFLALATVHRVLPVMRFELQATLPWTPRRGPNYHLQVPPEYHPGRQYPVMIVLHELGERPVDLFNRWSSLAAQHGYILAAPEWQRAPGIGYTYTSEEHRAVLEVIRDLRQRFQVDSDRVFLFGQGEGGNMAFDVGLSHPDQFAGVLPMSGQPQFFALKYWPNAQYLPFYVVDGDLHGDGAKNNRRQFDNWIPHGYPSLFVQYKGRGQEWFGGELPYMMDWMDRKKRAQAFPDLGRPGSGPFGDEFQSMRASDNRFYWLVGEELNDRHTNDSSRSFSFKVGPATAQARINPGNQINLNVHGFRRIVLWLGPGMIDYEKPVKIVVNAQGSVPIKKVTPNLATLLEDYYERADRQRLFYAKVEVEI